MTDVTSGGAEFDRERVYPVLPLRDIVVFPGMIVPLFVGREKSVKALEEVMRDDKHILVVTQKNAQDDDPSPDQIYATGAIASVLQLLKLPDGTVKVLVEGLSRATIDRYLQTQDYFEAEATVLAEPAGDPVEIEALARSAQAEFENYVKLNKKISAEVVAAVGQIENHSKLADTIASHLVIKIGEKEDLLATVSVAERLQKILGLMEGEIGVLQVEKRIRGRVKRQMEKTQREYYLNEQMKAIQRELGDGEEGSNELTELEAKIAKTKFTKEARDRANAELKKLKQMSPMSAEATVGPQLPRLAAEPAMGQEDQDQARPELCPGSAGCGSLWPREGQGADRRVPGGAEPHRQAQGPDPVPRRPPRRRQDLAWQVDRQGDRPRVRAHVAGRRA